MEKTYTRRVVELAANFRPAHHHFITGEEMKTVRKMLGLNELDTELELRNMRDVTVLYMDTLIDRAIEKEDSKEAMDLMDLMSAVTGVIDDALWNKRYGV